MLLLSMGGIEPAEASLWSSDMFVMLLDLDGKTSIDWFRTCLFFSEAAPDMTEAGLFALLLVIIYCAAVGWLL